MSFPDRQTQRFTGFWRHGRSPLLPILIAANVAGFVIQLLIGFIEPNLPERFLALSRPGLASGYYWQPLTYMFLHGDLLHLLVNMLTLYFAGRQVEAIVGPKHFLGIYFIGGILGGLAQLLLDLDGPLVGASAGVCAVLVAFTTIVPEMELTMLFFFIIPVRLRAKNLARFLVGFSVLAIAFKVFPNWGHLAHLGGAVIGWLYIKQLGYGNPLRLQRYFFEKKRREERFQQMTPEQFINEEIDPILDKIAREGIHSLTRTEKRILEKGRDKIARRTSNTKT